MRSVWLALSVINGVLLTCVLCPPVTFVIPDVMAFWLAFTVENQTSELLRVTPVGVGQDSSTDDRIPLPILTDIDEPYMATQRGGFGVPPGEKIELIYDWDDINFSELVVEDEGGRLRQLVVNPNPWPICCNPAEQTAFVISDLSKLDPVPEKVHRGFIKAQRPWNPTWRAQLMCGWPWLTFPLVLGLYFRTRHNGVKTTT